MTYDPRRFTQGMVRDVGRADDGKTGDGDVLLVKRGKLQLFPERLRHGSNLPRRLLGQRKSGKQALEEDGQNAQPQPNGRAGHALSRRLHKLFLRMLLPFMSPATTRPKHRWRSQHQCDRERPCLFCCFEFAREETRPTLTNLFFLQAACPVAFHSGPTENDPIEVGVGTPPSIVHYIRARRK
jgi:hypothetical protein